MQSGRRPMEGGQSSQELAHPKSTPTVLQPLFTPEQHQQLVMMQEQAPMIYGRVSPPTQGLLTTRPEQLAPIVSRSETPPDFRLHPQFLMMQERQMQDQLQRDELRILVQQLVDDNSKLRNKLKDLETKVDEKEDIRYSTPDNQATAGQREVQEADRPPEEADRPPQEAARPSIQNTPVLVPPRFEVETTEPTFPRDTEGQRGRSEGHDQQQGPPPRSGENGRPQEPGNNRFNERSMEFMALVVESMRRMQEKLGEGREESGVVRGIEVVRHGPTELPALPAWSAQQGPLQLGDWMLLIEPVISDLSATSEEWWRKMVASTEAWYNHHMSLPPLEKLQHEATAPIEVRLERWQKLERRVASMMLQAVPEGVREDLVAGRKVSVFAIMTHLLLVYAPGGVLEKQTLLKNIEEPGEIHSIHEAPGAVRRWLRWKQRAVEVGATMPDPALQMKGLNRLMRKLLDTHRDLQFRVSLARNTLGVDVVPTSASVAQFAVHLLAEVEQLSLSDKRASTGGLKQEQPKIRSMEAEGQEKGKGKGKERSQDEERQKCKLYLTEGGCKKGKECRWSHDQRDEKKRCYNCGGTDHFAPTCPRPKGSKESSPKAKTMKTEQKEEGGSSKKKTEEGEDQGSPGSVKDLLEEASKVLKSLTGPSSTSTPSSEKETDEAKEVMDRLHQQLKALRVFRVHRMTKESDMGLIDSGATHCLRPLRPHEDGSQYPKVMVSLANGNQTRLMLSPGGVMISEESQVEPIIPMGLLVSELKCTATWEGSGMKLWHPERGEIKVKMIDQCPHIPRLLALELINELEDQKKGIKANQLEFKAEEAWMRDLVKTHPTLKKLPSHIKDNLVVEPGSWNDLPGNRKMRKRWKKTGLVAHLFAGPEEGFTLTKAWKQQGGNPADLLEIDILRGARHDFLADKEAVYPGLLRAAVEGKLNCILGGPNCRTRSVLRHFPVPGVPTAPRPVRRWGGEEFGVEDMTVEEKTKVVEDDVMLWRMIFLMVVASQVRKARRIPEEVGFGLEQPSSPKEYKPECVSLWDTEEWKEIKKEFGFAEVNVMQNRHGAAVTKPTTFGGNLELDRKKHETGKGENITVKTSKELSRWPPGIMTMVAEAALEKVYGKEPKIRKVSWNDHVAMGHCPYRRDCLICQQTQQQAAPHRKVPFPRGGVLSLDVTGPLVKAYDAGGAMVRYALVGAMTWAVPTGNPQFRDAEFHEEQLPEGAPEIEEEREEEDGEEVEEEEQVPRPDWQEDPVIEEAEEKQIKEAEEQDAKKENEFMIKTFRMITTLKSKKAAEVARGAMELILRLKSDGYGIYQIHVDQGHEFRGAFAKWAIDRGYKITRTAADNPQQNGRVENAVKCLKAQIRRTLLAGGVGPELWPWALKYVNEMNRLNRLENKPQWPTFNQLVLVRKRTWVRGGFEPTSEFVRFLAPSPENHGYWVKADGRAPRLTRYYLLQGKEPTNERQWLAIEREALEEMAVRRRMREKAAIRRVIMTEEDEDEREEERQEEGRRHRVLKIIEEEMKAMIMDDPVLVAKEIGILKALKQETEPMVNEEEEILQTKIVSPKEVSREWDKWKVPVASEINSLLQEKEAMKEVSKKEVEEILKKRGLGEKAVEYLPSKCVFTKKPGKGKLKMRWVVCGNFEPVKPGEENFSSGGDAASFRILVAAAAINQWEAATVDVKTAFLNATMVVNEEENLLVVLPPKILVENGALPVGKFYIPLKAVYGFRRSPRLWGIHRDDTVKDIKVKIKEKEGEVELEMDRLVADPNIWRIQEPSEEAGAPGRLRGLMMTYVDDIFITGEEKVVEEVLSEVQKRWATSPPTWVSEESTRFLGMEVFKQKNEEKDTWDWVVNQSSYIKDLLSQQEEQVHPRKTPITRELSLNAQKEEEKKVEDIRRAQKAVGELLWIVTRTRLDLMYSVARMGSQVLRNPNHVIQMYKQVIGYLLNSSEDGIIFVKPGGDEPLLIETFADSSFSPEGEESHGAFIVCLGKAPILWRSGRQGLITLSTAESELVELVESMTAGESVSALVQEIFEDVPKRAWTDSQSAIAILASDSSSWRTRHLKMRAASARELVISGEWCLQHQQGLTMTADMGTKALSSARLEMLKKEAGMRCVKKKVEKEEKEVEKDTTEKEEGKKVEEAKAAIKLIVLATMITAVKGCEEDEEEEAERTLNWIIVAYTAVVVLATVLIQWMLKVAVGGSGSLEESGRAEVRSRPAEAEEKKEGEDEEEEDEVPQTAGVAGLGETHLVQAPASVGEGGSGRGGLVRLPTGTDVVFPFTEIAGVAGLGETHLVQAPASVGEGGSGGGGLVRLPTGTDVVFPSMEERLRTAEVAPLPEEDQNDQSFEEVQEEETTLEERIINEIQMIEEEEAQMWYDIFHGPMLTTQDEEGGENQIQLETFVIKTPYGKVYHMDRNCVHLTNPNVRSRASYQWCQVCARVALATRGRPPAGVDLYLPVNTDRAHTDERCPRRGLSNRFRACIDCRIALSVDD